MKDTDDYSSGENVQRVYVHQNCKNIFPLFMPLKPLMIEAYIEASVRCILLACCCSGPARRTNPPLENVSEHFTKKIMIPKASTRGGASV